MGGAKRSWICFNVDDDGNVVDDDDDGDGDGDGGGGDDDDDDADADAADADADADAGNQSSKSCNPVPFSLTSLTWFTCGIYFAQGLEMDGVQAELLCFCEDVLLREFLSIPREPDLTRKGPFGAWNMLA